MPVAIDGCVVPMYLDRMPCGGRPRFDEDSGCSYRCEDCFATIGSVGQSEYCKKINEEAKQKAREK